MPAPSNPGKKPAASRTGDIVIIAVFALGVLLPAAGFLWKLPLPPIFSSFLLGMAASALVYRFLGGIGSTTGFNLGPLQLGGSLAALVGVTWFLNPGLESQTRGYSLDNLFKPHHDRWLPVEKESGKPLRVQVGGLGELAADESFSFANIPLRIDAAGEEWQVKLRQSEHTVGRLAKTDLENLVKDATAYGIDGFIVSRFLRSGERYTLDPSPFTLLTRQYDDGYSSFALLDGRRKELYRGRLQNKQAQVIRLEGKSYLMAVVAANHEGSEPVSMFAFGLLEAEFR
jgi:hypothetical protein